LDADTALYVVGLALATALLLLVTAAETSVIYLSRSRARVLAGKGGSRGQILQRYVAERASLFAVLRFSRNLVLLLGVALLFMWTSHRFGADGRTFIGTALVAVAMVGVIEGLPQLVVARQTERWALVLAPMVALLRLLFRGPAWLLDRPGALLARLFPSSTMNGEDEEQEDLLRLVELEESNGAIEQEERQMIRGVIRLVETTAREIMVPRVDIAAVEAGATMADVERLIVERGFSRIPLYEESIDNIVGVIYAKDVLQYLAEGRQPESLKALARPPYFIPETKKVDELLTELRQNKIQIAIVVDEYGGTAGLVTTEDILEEIVGEIEDEYDVEEAPIERVSAHEAVLDARVGIEALNEMFGIDIPNADYDTVGGIIFTELGRVPVAGDEVRVDGIRLHVLSVIGRRIKKVRVTKLTAQPAET
jgi:CBS domain containing-hemolysin-like protein